MITSKKSNPIILLNKNDNLAHFVPSINLPESAWSSIIFNCLVFTQIYFVYFNVDLFCYAARNLVV